MTLGANVKSDYAALLALLSHKLRDRELAQDLINQAYVEALDKLAAGQIQHPELLGGYVYRVAFNLLRNHRRRMDNRGDLRAAPDAVEHISGAMSPYEEVFAASIHRHLRELLSELPVKRDREVLQRFYLDEDDKDTVCHELEIAPRHFDKILFRARRRIREMLDGRGLGREDLVLDRIDAPSATCLLGCRRNLLEDVLNCGSS